MKKNILFISVSLGLILLLGIGISYSMWNISVSQDNMNTISTDCFDLTISNKNNNISLENAYPISNSKGMKLTPYTFTVKNTCNITAQYSINLEVLNKSTLASKFINVMLDGNINLLSSYETTDKINSSSIENRKLDTGILKSNESKDYTLRLWIDYDTTLEDLDNETKSFKAKVNIIGKPINYTGDTVFNFDYTGGEQVFTVPVSGTYKLETWGAQGGDNIGLVEDLGNIYDTKNQSEGGDGGYSVGAISKNSGDKLFINVGGKGTSAKSRKNNENYLTTIAIGGYNGGANSNYTDNAGDWYVGSGGGATNIASRSGLLYLLEDYKSDILIVSGGGGGSYYYMNGLEYYHYGFGGSGGGYKGNSSYNTYSSHKEVSNADVTGGYQQIQNISYVDYGIKAGTFGYGGAYLLNKFDKFDTSAAAGGGGGYYGGSSSYARGAGGGSGYIGNSLLKNKIMYCYNCEESSSESTKTISTTCSEETPISYCAKKGNGYARITLISIDE